MGRSKSWSVWKRPIFFILWSRLSFLLFTPYYHLKDLPNKSIMLNEHGEKWQSCNWAFKITLQMHLINTLVKEPLDFHPCTSGELLFLQQGHCELAETAYCFPMGSDRSVKLMTSINFSSTFTLSCQSHTFKKKNIFLLHHYPPNYSVNSSEIRIEQITPMAINYQDGQISITFFIYWSKCSSSAGRQSCLQNSLAQFMIIWQSGIHIIQSLFFIMEDL